MNRYLLDTNACIDFLLARSAPLTRRIGDEYGRLAISAVSAAELHVGSRRSSDPVADARRIDIFLNGVDVLSFDAAAARAYAEMVHQVGVRRGSFDLLIAAQAIAADMPLVTNNVRDFADLPGLRVENWTA